MNTHTPLTIVCFLAIGTLLSAAEPSTQPAASKTIELTILVSPNAREYAPAEDAAITKLIEQHNAQQDELAKVVLRGRCAWNLDGYEGKPREMRIEFDRAARVALLKCGQESCEVKGSSVTAGADTLTYVDALYLLVFRKYNPRGFRAAPAGQIEGKAVTVARGDGTSLEFDAQTGRLVRATLQTKAGAVSANFELFAPLASDGKAKPMIPTKVWLNVPDAFFPEGWAKKAKITLTIDPSLCQAKVAR